MTGRTYWIGDLQNNPEAFRQVLMECPVKMIAHSTHQPAKRYLYLYLYLYIYVHFVILLRLISFLYVIHCCEYIAGLLLLLLMMLRAYSCCCWAAHPALWATGPFEWASPQSHPCLHSGRWPCPRPICWPSPQLWAYGGSGGDIERAHFDSRCKLMTTMTMMLMCCCCRCCCCCCCCTILFGEQDLCGGVKVHCTRDEDDSSDQEAGSSPEK